MEPDKYQQAWQAHSSQTRVTVNADLLRKEVLRNQRDFQATILRRDVIEVGVGLLLLPYWIYQGLTSSLPWTWWLGVPAILWVIGFFVVDHKRHPQTPSDPGEPLLSCAQNSLVQLEHQIWLLRNVFWWYLLPFAISISAFFAQFIWSEWIPSHDWWAIFIQTCAAVFLFGVFYAVYGIIYYLNQQAVRMQLEPRRRELLALVSSLGDDSSSALSGEQPISMSAERVKWLNSPWKVFFAILGFVAIAFSAALFLSNCIDQISDSRFDNGYPKTSPFAAVRWQNSQPEVKVGEEWFKLISLNEVPASEIIAFSKRTYKNLWRMRFEEDLVELLTVMGHPPQDKVTLVVQSLTSQKTSTLEDVPMTRANRKAIRNAAQERERSEQEQPRGRL